MVIIFFRNVIILHDKDYPQMQIVNRSNQFEFHVSYNIVSVTY